MKIKKDTLFLCAGPKRKSCCTRWYKHDFVLIFVYTLPLFPVPPSVSGFQGLRFLNGFLFMNHASALRRAFSLFKSASGRLESTDIHRLSRRLRGLPLRMLPPAHRSADSASRLPD